MKIDNSKLKWLIQEVIAEVTTEMPPPPEWVQAPQKMPYADPDYAKKAWPDDILGKRKVPTKLAGQGTQTAWEEAERRAIAAVQGVGKPPPPEAAAGAIDPDKARSSAEYAERRAARRAAERSGLPASRALGWARVPTELQTVTPASIAGAEAAETAAAQKAARSAALKRVAGIAGRLGGTAAVVDAYKYGQWAQPGLAQQGIIAAAPEYLQTGEGYVVDPRDPDWDPEEPVKSKSWGLSDVDWSPEELVRPFLPRRGHTGGVGLVGTPEEREQRARELAGAINESYNKTIEEIVRRVLNNFFAGPDV